MAKAKMTKAELEDLVKKQAVQIEELEGQLADGDGFYAEMEYQVADLSRKLEKLEENGIYDLNNFKWRMQMDGLLTPQLEDFIENYLKFHNKL